jgi:hypothetical protein
VPFGLVQRADGRRILVDVGALAGVHIGTVLGLYRPAEERFDGEPLATAQVTEVRGSQALAELLQGEARAGMRAIVIGQDFPGEPLRLRLTLPTKDWDVTAKPDREALLKEVAEALRPVAYVRVIGEQESPDRVVTVSRQDRKWTLRLYSPPGGLLGEGQGDGAAAAVSALRPLLAREWMIKRCAAHQNPSPPFRLTVRDPKGANPTYRLGDEMTLHVQAEQSCQVVLLNVGATGRLTLLLPNRFRPELALRAGEQVTLPDPAMGFAFTAGRPAGCQYTKAIATLRPLDLPELKVGDLGEQPFRRWEPEEGVAFLNRLAAALTTEALIFVSAGSVALPGRPERSSSALSVVGTRNNTASVPYGGRNEDHPHDGEGEGLGRDGDEPLGQRGPGVADYGVTGDG